MDLSTAQGISQMREDEADVTKVLGFMEIPGYDA